MVKNQRNRSPPHHLTTSPPHYHTTFFPVGPEGLEPSRHGLRDRYAAASTLVPPVNVSRVGGTRTLTLSVKSRMRYRYATTPIVPEAGVYESEPVP